MTLGRHWQSLGLVVALVSGEVACVGEGATRRRPEDAWAAAPRAGVPPGQNFDLSRWELQEPIGEEGHPKVVGPAVLDGPRGFQDKYFFTDPNDGAMTFWDPESGVVTAHSKFPRSELRELAPGGAGANWPLAGTHTLSATVAVPEVPGRVCIGQIHVGSPLRSGLVPTDKPLVELYYSKAGGIELGIEESPAGRQTIHRITSVRPGSRFRYVIRLAGDGAITLRVDSGAWTFPMPPSFAGYGEYFKAGAYNQTVGSDPSVGATVKFYALSVTHIP